MNINEIIEELKTFSDEDLIKFNKVFSDFYKPYKKKLSAWKYEKDKQQQSEDGRTIMCVEVGKKQYIDSETNEIVREEFEEEEIDD